MSTSLPVLFRTGTKISSQETQACQKTRSLWGYVLMDRIGVIHARHHAIFQLAYTAPDKISGHLALALSSITEVSEEHTWVGPRFLFFLFLILLLLTLACMQWHESHTRSDSTSPPAPDT